MPRTALPVRAALALALLLPLPALAGDKEDRAAEKAFMDAYRAAGEDDKARAAAVETLRTVPDGLKASILLGKVLPRDDAPPVQTAATAVLRTVKDEAAVKAVVTEAQGNVANAVRTVAIEALGAFDAPQAVEGLQRILKKGDPKAVSAALFALAERHPPSVLDDVKKALNHSAWQVRIGAYEFLARLRDPGTVVLLADRLEEETGRLKQEVVEALKAVTGMDFKADALKWRAFAAGGKEAAEKAGAPAADPAGGGGGRAVATGDPPVEPTYYGEKVYSDKIVFVIDLSLSMNEEMVVDRDMIVRETGAVVSGGGPDGTPRDVKKEGEIIPIEWWKIRTRVDFARSQLKYVVSTLKRDQWFDIVWFSDSVKTWQGRMVPAQPAIKVRAADWLDELKCEGGTNTWGGLMKALNLVGRGTEDENYSRGADTIYFMSDGQPSVGDIKDMDQIVDAIERIHKVRRVKIHVVQIGTSPLPFMRRLAAVTGGNYRFFNAKGPSK